MLQIELHEEQNYVFEIARELKLEAPRILHHSRDTKTCAEKLALLQEDRDRFFQDWTLDRIVKALYFSRNDDPFIGVITPELEKYIEHKKIFSRVLGMSKTKAEDYWPNPNKVPTGMAWGTCTPFPLTSTMGTDVGKISTLIFLDHKPIRDKLVDISVGGSDKEAFQTSMHLPYMAIYEILKKKFGERVHLYSQ